MEALHSSSFVLEDGRHFCLNVSYDDDPISPIEECDNIGKMCIRKHRRYSFPNELDIDFDDLSNDDPYETDESGKTVKTISQHEMEKFADCHVFHLDCYEHGGMVFSLRGSGTQCRFDTSSNVGFVAVPKSEIESYEEALEIVEEELATFNAWLAGQVYKYSIVETFPLYRKDGTESSKTEDGEIVDSCGGIYNLAEIPGMVSHEFKSAVSDAYASSGGFSTH